MPKQKPYEEPLQHPLTQKPIPNELIVLSLYEGSKTHPTYKLIGRYQPKSKLRNNTGRIMGTIGERLDSVLINGNIYEWNSLDDKITFTDLGNWFPLGKSFIINDTFRYSWNAYSEETDAVYKKQFEQLKKKEIKQITKNTRGKIDPEVLNLIPTTPVKRCPNGTRRNKITKKCEQK